MVLNVGFTLLAGMVQVRRQRVRVVTRDPAVDDSLSGHLSRSVLSAPTVVLFRSMKMVPPMSSTVACVARGFPDAVCVPLLLSLA